MKFCSRRVVQLGGLFGIYYNVRFQEIISNFVLLPREVSHSIGPVQTEMLFQYTIATCDKHIF